MVRAVPRCRDWSGSPPPVDHRFVAAGQQPMATADGRFVLTYNGEIYNFLELRRELEAKGHKFHSRTDTEVLLTPGPNGAWRRSIAFNGMFAFAIWDKNDARLFLARDRYGIKPLYYARYDKHAAVRFGDQGISRPSGGRRPDGRSEALRGISDVPELLHRPHAVRGYSAVAGRQRYLTRRSATGRRTASGATGTSRSPSRTAPTIDEYARGARPAVHAGGDPAAGQRRAGRLLSSRRHGFRRRSRRSPRASSHDLQTFTGGFDLQLGVRPGTGLRRARSRRADVLSVQDRALRNGAEGRRHGTRHAAWSGTWKSRASARAIRISTPPSSPASSSRSCCRAPAATSCSAAIRGATTGRSSTTTSSTTSTSTTISGSGWCRTTTISRLLAPVWHEVEHVSDRATSSAVCSSAMPEHVDATGGLRQPFALLRSARPSCTACWSSRTSCRMAHGARDARAVPGQRSCRLRDALPAR